MHVRALFFAAYRDRVGASELPLDLPTGSTVADLVDALRSRGSPWEDLPPDPPVAVNRRWVPASQGLEEGDEIAFLPPVAGG